MSRWQPRIPVTLADVFAVADRPVCRARRDVTIELLGIGRVLLTLDGEHIVEAWGPDGFEIDRDTVTSLLTQQAHKEAA